jgi:hypothetical protein
MVLIDVKDLYHRDALLNTTVDQRLLLLQIRWQVRFGPIGRVTERMLNINDDQGFAAHGMSFMAVLQWVMAAMLRMSRRYQ